MRPKTISDSELLEALLSVLRSKGYDGASMKDFEVASGLKKASLYHRFPQGKTEIVTQIMAHVGSWLKDEVLSTLEDTDLSPQKRLKLGLKRISEFYDQGQETCLFRALSLDNGFELFHQQLQQGMDRWMSSFEALAKDIGYTPAQARQVGVDALVLIQGGLIVSKIQQDTKLFQSSLKKVEALYVF